LSFIDENPTKESTKSQAPSFDIAQDRRTKEIPSSKLQNQSFDSWNLDFFWNLRFDA